jgi:CRISPR-associated endonuclease/helicase Cas3
MDQHHRWVANRVKSLSKAGEVRRQAFITPVEIASQLPEDEMVDSLVEIISADVYTLHKQHYTVDPKSGGQVSFGLIRMANITPLIAVTCALAARDAAPGHHIHFCCYHSKHPLLVRSNIEKRLDALLNRKMNDEQFFKNKELRAAIDASDAKDHIFIVLATAVAEVGRDHDYDWAIVEPSSMRSIIQLAGRVRRHRSGSCATPNIALLDTNYKHLRKKGTEPAFCKPGFENKTFRLNSHRLTDLLTKEQCRVIDATSRIVEGADPHPRDNLVDLEHDHLGAVMGGDSRNRVAPVTLWWDTHAPLSGELQRHRPFRHDPQGRKRYLFCYDEENEEVIFSSVERDGTLLAAKNLLDDVALPPWGSGVSLWGEFDYIAQVNALAERLNMTMERCARRFGSIELPEKNVDQGWYYHPALGVWERK